MSASNAGPPRIGSATEGQGATTSRARVPPASASAECRCQRNATASDRLVRARPRRDRAVDRLVDAGSASPHGRAISFGPGRDRRRTRRAGCRAAAQAKLRQRLDEGSSPALRSRPNDRGAAAGLSISAARRQNRKPPRPSGCRRPEFMIPVCPVARKCASTPRRKGASDRKRRIFLPQRAVGSDGQKALARALRRLRWECPRAACGCRSDCGRALGPVAKLGNPIELRMHSTDNVEAGFERFDQRRNPGLRNEAARVRRRRSRAPCAAIGGVGRTSTAAVRRIPSRREAQTPQHKAPAPSRGGRMPVFAKPASSRRLRGTGGMAAGARASQSAKPCPARAVRGPPPICSREHARTRHLSETPIVRGRMNAARMAPPGRILL